MSTNGIVIRRRIVRTYFLLQSYPSVLVVHLKKIKLRLMNSQVGSNGSVVHTATANISLIAFMSL